MPFCCSVFQIDCVGTDSDSGQRQPFESIPLLDNSVAVINSNCVINLSGDKGRVLKESFRVLTRPGHVRPEAIAVMKELGIYIFRSPLEARTGIRTRLIRLRAHRL